MRQQASSAFKQPYRKPSDESILRRAAINTSTNPQLEPDNGSVLKPAFRLDSRHDFSRVPVVGKSEAAVGTQDKDKGIGVGGGLVLGALGGALVGALIGGLVGGGLGALIGLGIGLLVGGAIGAGAAAGGGGAGPAPSPAAAPAPTPAPAAAAGGTVAIAWDAANVTTDAAAANPTTVNRPFVPDYGADRDTTAHVWRMKVKSIKGGVNIDMHTGGYRNPLTNPPTTQAEAADAVTTMKAYYNNGRGSWHTEAASRAHEDHHYREWKCSAENYWPTARTAIQGLTVPEASAANEAAAVTALRTGPGKADAILAAFTKAAHDYWFLLSDSAPSRPYAAGQLVLNAAITNVQTLAAGKGWAVAAGVDTPSAEPPCYLAFPPWTP